MNASVMIFLQRRMAFAWLVGLLMLGGCATTPPPKSVDPHTPDSVPVTETTANPLAIHDPLEGFNRRVYRFNALTDKYVLLPVTRVYDKVTPDPVQTGVQNFFSNLAEINTFANSVLQLKPRSSGVTLSRFVVNSTVGLAGFFDPATHFGLAKRNEDFGQTLGHYGVGAGPYLVLPFLGPSDLRDAVGMGADFGIFYAIDPLQINDNTPASVAYDVGYVINTRDTTNFRYYQTGSPFEYTLVRLIYLNYRALQIEQ